MKNTCNILVGKSEGKKPTRTPRRNSEDNIETDLMEIGFEAVNWTCGGPL
jgi:hypothetical protein